MYGIGKWVCNNRCQACFVVYSEHWDWDSQNFIVILWEVYGCIVPSPIPISEQSM